MVSACFIIIIIINRLLLTVSRPAPVPRCAPACPLPRFLVVGVNWLGPPPPAIQAQASPCTPPPPPSTVLTYSPLSFHMHQYLHSVSTAPTRRCPSVYRCPPSPLMPPRFLHLSCPLSPSHHCHPLRDDDDEQCQASPVPPPPSSERRAAAAAAVVPWRLQEGRGGAVAGRRAAQLADLHSPVCIHTDSRPTQEGGTCLYQRTQQEEPGLNIGQACREAACVLSPPLGPTTHLKHLQLGPTARPETPTVPM